MTPDRRAALNLATSQRGLRLLAITPKPHKLILYVGHGTAPADLAGDLLEEALLQSAAAGLDKLVRQLQARTAQTAQA